MATIDPSTALFYILFNLKTKNYKPLYSNFIFKNNQFLLTSICLPPSNSLKNFLYLLVTFFFALYFLCTFLYVQYVQIGLLQTSSMLACLLTRNV